jgi:hypothetical protein
MSGAWRRADERVESDVRAAVSGALAGAGYVPDDSFTPKNVA